MLFLQARRGLIPYYFLDITCCKKARFETEVQKILEEIQKFSRSLIACLRNLFMPRVSVLQAPRNTVYYF